MRQYALSSPAANAGGFPNIDERGTMKIGYARVSTRRQNPSFQVLALERAGCNLIMIEKASGRAKGRLGLAAAVAMCGEGDTLVVWKIDRLGRDLMELVEIAKLLKARSAGLQILTGRAALIDIGTTEGRALYGIFAAFADLESAFGSDRTNAGIAAARLGKTVRQRRKARERGAASQTRKPLRCSFNRRA